MTLASLTATVLGSLQNRCAVQQILNFETLKWVVAPGLASDISWYSVLSTWGLLGLK